MEVFILLYNLANWHPKLIVISLIMLARDIAIQINEVEASARSIKVVPIPSKLKATIQFGYEDSMKSALESANQDFDSWISATFTHTQALFRHANSLGTSIEFQVRSCKAY